MTNITPNDVRKIVGNTGTFFRVAFIKRTTGEEREMTGRLNVQKHLKGGKPAYDFAQKGTLCVWIPEQDRRPDGKDNGYRAVPCDNILSIKAHGKTYIPRDGKLVEIE